jgi:PAS domain S-box-containing protein
VEGRLAALSAVAGDFVWLASPEGLLEDCLGWKDFTGQSAPQMQGWGWLNALHPADRERVRDAMLTQPGAERNEGEYRLRTRTGDYVWVRSRGAPVAHKDGWVGEWIGVIERRPVAAEASGKAGQGLHAGAPNGSDGPLDRQVIGGAQIRAARALVNWSVRELAKASGVSASTIRRTEEEVGYPENRDHGRLCMLRNALEAAGVEFLCSAGGRGGVKLAPG